jgi:TolB protein
MTASTMKRSFLKTIALGGAAACFYPLLSAHAQLRVEISGVGANQIPIAIGQFFDDPASDNQVTSIIKADLQRSGLFRVISSNDLTGESGNVDDARWKALGADALVGGRLRRVDGRVELRYRLRDTTKGADLAASALTVNPQFIRLAAHRIADDIFEKLTGIRGPFATRIAYVAKSGGEYRLEVADSDGENAFTAFRDTEPVISPVWSPDGTRLAYVSFNTKKPVVYVQELATRRRIAVANFKGSNSAPAWSPDGRRLAIALSRDGLTQVYLINADGGDLKRLTNSGAIDTEPCFSPDGQFIYFTSDRSGGPQIYRMNADGGDVRRISFNGSYNISPAISPDGKMLSYISRRDGRFQVYVLELATAQELRLSDGPRDESPSFAPNSRYLLYASETSGQGNLSVVAVDGSTRYTLSAKASAIREPAWGPFTK